MKKIKMNQNKFALVDDENYNLLSKFHWYSHPMGYAQTGVWNYKTKRKKTILMHKIVNPTPKNVYTDHINQNKLDNRKINLRACTLSFNCANRTKQINNQSGFKGVCKYIQRHAIKWVAYIRKNGKTFNLGYYWTPQEAALAYNEKAKEFFGDFAYLNKL